MAAGAVDAEVGEIEKAAEEGLIDDDGFELGKGEFGDAPGKEAGLDQDALIGDGGLTTEKRKKPFEEIGRREYEEEPDEKRHSDVEEDQMDAHYEDQGEEAWAE